MLILFSQHRRSGNVPSLSPGYRPLRRRRMTLSLSGRMTLASCLLIGHTVTADMVPSPPPGNEKNAASFPTEEGLTRESLAEPKVQPTSLARVTTPTASGLADRRSAAARARAFRRHRRRLAHHHSPTPRVTIVKTAPRPRRNPAASFVFWWNGWVIRTLHTRVGTVMLGTIGAKT